MSKRLKLIVSYDGSPFAGWQSQSNGNAVQDHLERAFGAVTGAAVRVHGAGRTDAGVHAIGQCAHVDLAEPKLSAERWPGALNASLPPTIRVVRAGFVGVAFHARYSAVGKVYHYRIWNARVLSPLETGRVSHVPTELNLTAMRAAAAKFVGTHDFAAFAANRGKPESNTVRTVEYVRLSKAGSVITLRFSGNGFLYKMVRIMVAALVRCGLGKMSGSEIAGRLSAPAEGRQQPRFVAPAEGLFLVRVRY